MERKTKIEAKEGRNDLMITREFDLPVGLLFKAYVEIELLEQWMGTKVIKLENKAHGGWKFETSDPQGNVVFSANGTIHDILENEKIIRTFEMENSPFPVQLEFLEFENTGDESSNLNMQIVYKSVEVRDQMLKLPFAYGLNMAHDKLEQLFNNKIS